VKLKMPYPPTLNTYYRNWRGRTVISAEGLKYRKSVAEVAAGVEKMTGRISMSILVCPPDARRRDLDNVCKATLDALQKAAVYDDDSQIDRLEIVRGNKSVGGFLLIELEEI
jgi:crossover junction endodeoxyribonuclease RusA